MRILLVVGDDDVLYLFDPHPESFEIELESNGDEALKRYRDVAPMTWSWPSCASWTGRFRPRVGDPQRKPLATDNPIRQTLATDPNGPRTSHP
jgi:hypothetical protein